MWCNSACRPRRQRPPLIQKHSERDVLRVLLRLRSIFAIVGRGDLHALSTSLLKKKLQSVGIAEFGDAMEISDQPLGIVVLGAREEGLNRAACLVRLLPEYGDVEPMEAGLMALQKPA